MTSDDTIPTPETAPARGERAATRARLNAAYVARREDREARQAINDVIEQTLEGPEGCGACLVGPTGAGKSTLVDRLIRQHPELSRGKGAPLRIIGIRVPGPCTLAELGRRVCAEAGYPYESNSLSSAVWARARHVLRLERIGFIYFDEIQNVFETANREEGKKLRNTIKTLMNDAHHPMGLIMSGQPSIVPFLLEDGQVARRVSFLEIRPLDPRKLEDLLKALANLARIAGLEADGTEMARVAPRLMHAALYQFGTALQIARRAIGIAMDAGPEEEADGQEGAPPPGAAPRLLRAHFATAFARKSGNAAFANPFLAKDWAALDCSLRLVTRPEQLVRVEEEPAPAGKGRGR